MVSYDEGAKTSAWTRSRLEGDKINNWSSFWTELRKNENLINQLKKVIGITLDEQKIPYV